MNKLKQPGKRETPFSNASFFCQYQEFGSAAQQEDLTDIVSKPKKKTCFCQNDLKLIDSSQFPLSFGFVMET